MKEFQIQNLLFSHLVRKGFCLSCPNYTPLHWWECDVFALTGAGCFVEFEIKVSRADFLADKKKGKKHERLAAHDKRGPSRFFYLTPKGLLTPEDIPEWAGHIELDGVQFRIVKEAPFLHREKVGQRVLDHVHGIFYWRFWNLRRGYKPDDCGQPADKAETDASDATLGPLDLPPS